MSEGRIQEHKGRPKPNQRKKMPGVIPRGVKSSSPKKLKASGPPNPSSSRPCHSHSSHRFSGDSRSKFRPSAPAILVEDANSRPREPAQWVPPRSTISTVSLLNNPTKLRAFQASFNHIFVHEAFDEYVLNVFLCVHGDQSWFLRSLDRVISTGGESAWVTDIHDIRTCHRLAQKPLGKTFSSVPAACAAACAACAACARQCRGRGTSVVSRDFDPPVQSVQSVQSVEVES